MNKRLKKYTTIPEHLYISRNADAQLKRIIDDMQRPGYVLVARQMGKTNLLFNAKRTLENENRLFVYVDLSNLFDNERDCYRNIIDNIIEPNLDFFEYIEDEIENIRAKNLQPHNEYSRCLRTILKLFTGDIVIVLDEIDALKSVDYSDNIFAQIRSNYFSRTNFPEFERLTYVLSGVIEPTELIKDPNKSPFNIGDKIYLDDFTKDEHNNFVQKSGLEITSQISDEIFNWANGNPRMTFDICSELENHLLSGEEIGEGFMTTMVKKKYLTAFDIPPIDHIREIVKKNKQIRSAVSLINKNRSSELSDEIRKKLYLYGIIDSKFGQDILIKNKVIEQSLSEGWIKSIEKESGFTLVNGLLNYDNDEFFSAIEIFLDIIQSSNTKDDIETASYFLGLSYYQLTDYDEAIKYLSKEYFIKNYAADAKLYLGICKLGNGAKEEGISILEESIKCELNNLAYLSALLNLALSVDDKEKATNYLVRLYKSSYEARDVKEKDLVELRTLSLYYQAEILFKDSKSQESLKRINKALENANDSQSLYLILFKYFLQIPSDESLKTQLVDKIIDNKLVFAKQKSYPINFSENLLYSYLNFVFESSDPELFERLLNYSADNLLPSYEKYEIIYKTALTSQSKGLELLNYLTKFSGDIPKEFLIEIYRQLASNQSKNRHNFFEAFNKYLNLFNESDKVNANDVYTFAMAIKLRYDQGNFVESIKLGKNIESKISNIDDQNLIAEFAIVYYWLSLSYYSVKDRINAIDYADLGLKRIQESNKKATSMIDEEGWLRISEDLRQIKKSSNISQPIVKDRKYGKNERVRVKYPDGREKEDKYKKLESDIVAKRCIITITS